MATMGANANPGEIVAGRYRIEQWVGQGNMAMVFRATHLGTGRACALKLVHAHLVERPEIQEMFVQEARIGGRIGKNPYIVDVFDAGIDSDRGVPFLAMDLLEGTTLDKYIKQYGQMPPGLLKTLWIQLADALEQAHAAGVVHRDLKPGNLFLTYDRKGNPQLRVVDFGIAKLMEEGVQRTATQIGTPAYAAPEQLGNGMRMMAERMGFNVSTTISPATDIWALGVVTYEMLIGAPPGQLWTGLERGSATDLLVLVATGPVPSGTARAGARGVLLPPGFDSWLERCLHKNAMDRWPSVELAVQNLVALFDAGSNRLPTLKLPSSTLVATRQDQSANATMLLRKNEAPASDGTNPQAARNSSSLTDSTPSQADESKQSSRTQLDILSGSNSLQSGAPRIDGTQHSISETVTPKRAKRVRKAAAASITFLLVTIGAIALIHFILPKAKTTDKNTPTASPSVISSLPSSTPNLPVEVPAIVPPEPTSAPSTAMSAPSALLPAKQPTPKTPNSANEQPPPMPNASVSSTPAPTSSMPSPPVTATAILNINSIPVSKVILDGKPIGSTPKVGISVPIGTRTVVFIHPDKGKKTVSVTLKAGETKTAAVKF